MDSTTGHFFWGFLVVYGVVMFLLSPKTVSLGGFFKGEDRQGRAANPWMITASIFIAWIFAKSVTNAANMGASFGIVGGIGDAMYLSLIHICRRAWSSTTATRCRPRRSNAPTTR